MFESQSLGSFCKQIVPLLTEHYDVIDTQTKNCMRSQIAHTTPLGAARVASAQYMLPSGYFISLHLALGAIWVWDPWYKPPWLTNISSCCFAAIRAKMSTLNSYEWTASSSLHLTPELEQWTWLLCRVSVSRANKLSLQGLTQLMGIKLLISRFQEIFAS